MSKPPTEPRDWSSASEALFRAARTDHASSAADRERVRGGLAQRLADASNTPLGGGDSQLEAASKTGVALSTLAKIGIGVVIVAAGALAVLRTSESPQPAEEKPAARASEKTAPSAPVATPVVTSIDPLPVTPVQSAPPASAARRSIGRTPSASVAMHPRPGSGRNAKRTTNPLEAPGEPANEPSNSTPAVAEASRKDARELPAPSASDAHQATAARQQAAHGGDGSARRAPPSTEGESVHPASTHAESGSTQRDPSERTATGAELDPSDPRAELVFARRMQAAMLAGQPTEVLALCAEHERRWPHGTFVQEREGLRAMASCQADARDATTRANRFLGTYPRSTLAPRVRQACAEHL